MTFTRQSSSSFPAAVWRRTFLTLSALGKVGLKERAEDGLLAVWRQMPEGRRVYVINPEAGEWWRHGAEQDVHYGIYQLFQALDVSLEDGGNAIHASPGRYG